MGRAMGDLLGHPSISAAERFAANRAHLMQRRCIHCATKGNPKALAPASLSREADAAAIAVR